MLLAHEMKNTLFNTLQHCAKRFSGIRMDSAIYVLFATMIDRLMSCKILGNMSIRMMLIRDQTCLSSNICIDHRTHGGNAVVEDRKSSN